MAFDTGNMIMPVQPTGGGGFDGDAWLILIIIFALFGGGFGGWGNGGLNTDFPWLMNGQNAINANTNAGFNQAATATQLSGIQSAITGGFGDTALGIAGVNQNICQTGNSITQQLYSNQIADLERSFAAQTAQTAGLTNISNQLSNCCCENRAATQDLKYTLATEACADRAAISNGIRDILTATQAQTQTILDKMCQQEIDALKERNTSLQNQILMKDLAASQTAQTAALVADNTAQTQYLVNRIAPYPIPSYTVPNPYVPVVFE